MITTQQINLGKSGIISDFNQKQPSFHIIFFTSSEYFNVIQNPKKYHPTCVTIHEVTAGIQNSSPNVFTMKNDNVYLKKSEEQKPFL